MAEEQRGTAHRATGLEAGQGTMRPETTEDYSRSRERRPTDERIRAELTGRIEARDWPGRRGIMRHRRLTILSGPFAGHGWSLQGTHKAGASNWLLP